MSEPSTKGLPGKGVLAGAAIVALVIVLVVLARGPSLEDVVAQREDAVYDKLHALQRLAWLVDKEKPVEPSERPDREALFAGYTGPVHAVQIEVLEAPGGLKRPDTDLGLSPTFPALLTESWGVVRHGDLDRWRRVRDTDAAAEGLASLLDRVRELELVVVVRTRTHDPARRTEEDDLPEPPPIQGRTPGEMVDSLRRRSTADHLRSLTALTTFQPGRYEGEAFLCGLDPIRVIDAFPFEATNSESVEVERGGTGERELDKDLMANARASLASAFERRWSALQLVSGAR